jgi:hypothetical protein
MAAAHKETDRASNWMLMCTRQQQEPEEQQVRVSLVVEVIEEDAAQAAALAPVLDQEVVVAPLPELLIVLGVVLVADLRRGNATGCVSTYVMPAVILGRM